MLRQSDQYNHKIPYMNLNSNAYVYLCKTDIIADKSGKEEAETVYICSPLDLFGQVPASLLIHFSCVVVGRDGIGWDEAPALVGGSSAGSAAAELVKAFRTRNANIGERSNPPSGGMIPRNMFKYGSHSVLEKTIQMHQQFNFLKLRSNLYSQNTSYKMHKYNVYNFSFFG